MSGEGSSNAMLADRSVKFRVKKNGRKDKVIVERSAAEGLPEGWIKELAISKNAGKLRKDPFFIDPKSGYIFFSLKDASRYVRTGIIGKYARKPKETNHDDDSAIQKTHSPSGSTEKRSAENENNIKIYVRNSKRKNISALDAHSENSNASSLPHVLKEGRTKSSIQRQHISRGETDTMTHYVEKRVTRSQAKAKKNDDTCEVEGKSPSLLNEKADDYNISSEVKTVNSPTPEDGSGEKKKANSYTAPEKEAVERRVTRSRAKVMNDDDSCEWKRKIDHSDNLPQRDSKRLAGCELEPSTEPETGTGAQTVPSVELSDGAGAVLGKNHATNCEMTIMPPNEVVTEKTEEQNKHDLPSEEDTSNLAAVKGDCSSAQIEEKPESVSEPVVVVDSNMADMWNDPCIAFAIKTLTGESLGPIAAPDLLPEQQPKTSNAVTDHDELRKVNSFAVMPGSSTVSSNQEPQYSADIWKDPCIDFAIKTLTGAIPVGFDEQPKDQSCPDHQVGMSANPRIN